MAQSAPPAQQQATRSYLTWQQSSSADNLMPPAKRQRLSPNSTSPSATSTLSQTPYGSSPNLQNINLPNAFSQRPLNGISQLAQRQGINGMRESMPRHGVGNMGPPQRPVEKLVEKKEEQEKHMDVNDLSDAVASSGVDINEEEKYITTYRTEQSNIRFAPQSSQHGSQHNYDLLFHNNFNGIGTNRGTFGPTAATQTQEEELYEKHKLAARKFNEGQQNHLSDPFLSGIGMRIHVEKWANLNGIKIPVEGLFDRIPQRPVNMAGTSMTAADGSQIVTVSAPSILNRTAPLEGIFSLLSLAANERIRGLMEDAYGLARGRRMGSDGVVPPEWSDLAVGNDAIATTAVPMSITKTAWDDPPLAVIHHPHPLPSPPNSNEQSPKRSPSQPPKPLSTIALPPSPLAAALSTLSRTDRSFEEARLKRRAERAKRKAVKAAADASTSSTTTTTANGSATNGNPTESRKAGLVARGLVAPEAAKLTKKEQARLAKQSDISDEVATRNANATAVAQLGGKSYSWMQSAGQKANNANALGGRQGGALGSGLGGAMTGGAQAAERKFGGWREDGVGGRGVQLRDWVAALEGDGRERRTMAWALTRLDGERVVGG